MNKRLTRSKNDRMLMGICGGLAEYFELDPTLVRIAYLLLCFFSVGFGGLILYIIMAIVVPEKRDF